jgi:hypothetical protein
LQFRTPCDRFFSFLSHVHLQPFSFILNLKALKCLHTFDIQNTAKSWMFVLLMMPHVGPMIRQYNIFYSILFYFILTEL